MGRYPNGTRPLTNAEHQALWRQRNKVKRERQKEDYRLTATQLEEANVELNRMEYVLSLRETDETYKQLKAENDRVKNSNYNLMVKNRKLLEDKEKLELDIVDLKTEIELLKESRYSRLSDSNRRTLVLLLGMLGSSFKGERDNAAQQIEKLRKRLDKSWDDLI